MSSQRDKRQVSPRRRSRSPGARDLSATSTISTAASSRRRSRSPRRGRTDESRERRDMSRERVAAAPQASISGDDASAPVEKEQPNFGLSGKLAAETNTQNGVVVKYVEPAEARMPTSRWRLYVFKKDEHLDVLHLHRKSSYLVGKDRRIADIPTDHPSCSKQHAAIQFRLMTEQMPVNQLGTAPSQVIKPFVIDLESTNGTFVNDERIPASHYYELRPKDTLRFGCSTREYVVLREDQTDQDADESSDAATSAAEPEKSASKA